MRHVGKGQGSRSRGALDLDLTKAGRAVPALSEFYDFRDRLLRGLERDLLGPSREDEVLSDPPITRYITGILFPTDNNASPPEQDGELDDEVDEGGPPDAPVAMAHVRYPSSMGLTFAVDLAVTRKVTVAIQAARYEPSEPPEPDEGEEASGPGPRRRRARSIQWRRMPIEVPPIVVDVGNAGDERRPVAEGLELFIRVRHPDDRGLTAVTLILINLLKAARRQLRDEFAFFQPQIQVTAPLDTSAFVGRRLSGHQTDDADIRSYSLLYRHTAAIAVGHGCSAEWTRDSVQADRATSIRTAYVPRHEVPVADTRTDHGLAAGLGMRHLARSDRAPVLADLELLCAAYEKWIKARRTESKSLQPDLLQVANEHLDRCTDAANRIRRGIELLRSDDQAWRAFQLANQAILQVRARTAWKDAGRPSGGPDESGEHTWRPFQVAFQLVCLDGLSDPQSADRGIADLLWFPTGGGKTEAYLGLVAYTVFLRRLRGRGRGAGVTAIMRYTLRLLTIQQFERACLLICSCEEIRRAHTELGSEPITIGLWVGRAGTPNTLKAARIALDKLRRGDAITLDEGNPMQLQVCPWCGTPLKVTNYYIAQAVPRLVITCKTPTCAFRDELPVKVVDDDVYATRPSLLIATADKFASLPWRESVSTLFGGNGFQPPELIIQDELHLISGPLGTLAGLYETAIDLLCSSNGIPPKVIASTATIRRAAAQTAGLFNRDVRQFPPPGIDSRDSYFAVEASRETRAARLYAGLMAPGSSHATLLIRTYAALLHNASAIPAAAAVKDPYWTLVGYFNSLRVLAGGRMQVQDDVPERLKQLAEASGSTTRTLEKIELTSRESSGDIPSHLRRMAVAYPDAAALDVILATNMISVGVDIDRLGLMVVMGQPPSTSEYIQATSRVGRRYPGLIIALYNAARSRDRSHYERFVDYHSALYRQVESTSVTPFSPRARDRALHAVFIALARLLIPRLAARDAAARVSEAAGDLEEVKGRILARVRRIAPEEYDATARQLNEIHADWVERAETTPGLLYDDYEHPDRALLVEASEGDGGEGPFPTLWSLRDVDKASALYRVR